MTSQIDAYPTGPQVFTVTGDPLAGGEIRYNRGTYVFANDGLSGAASYTLNIAGVPEPASWALLVSGFTLSGAALRRRRVVAAG